MAKKRSWVRWTLVITALVVVAIWVWTHRMGQPDDYGPMEDQYKYGSIGADHPLATAPLPYWIWKVMPTVIPPLEVIEKKFAPRNGKPGLEMFGLVTEPKMPDTYPPRAASTPVFERPVGFSRRKVLGVDLLGMNCAFCHQGTVRVDDKAKPHLVLGGVGQTVDVEMYFLYVFSALKSPKFNADMLMPAIDDELLRQGATLNWAERALYRWVLIPFLPWYAGALEQKDFDFLIPGVKLTERERAFGPGRVDTWAVYKRVFVRPPDQSAALGTVDFPSIWNQKAREGMRLHWDGNTDVLVERNVVSALGLVGKRIEYLDYPRLSRVTQWITGLLPPRLDDLAPDGKGTDAALALRGAGLFDQHCASCHAIGGMRTGRVEPIEGLGTDPERMKAFTVPLAAALNRLTTDQWALRDFRVQNGYVNMPLDGIWLRAPYLHNGSVPTLKDLLAKPEDRPKSFCRGGDLYDFDKLGYFTEPLDAGGHCPNSWRMDTTKPGHSNAGHLYGTSLSDEDKRAVLEFMKTL